MGRAPRPRHPGPASAHPPHPVTGPRRLSSNGLPPARGLFRFRRIVSGLSVLLIQTLVAGQAAHAQGVAECPLPEACTANGPAPAACSDAPDGTLDCTCVTLIDANYSAAPAGSLVGATFDNAALCGAQFSGQDLTGVSFKGAVLGPSQRGISSRSEEHTSELQSL